MFLAFNSVLARGVFFKSHEVSLIKNHNNCKFLTPSRQLL